MMDPSTRTPPIDAPQGSLRAGIVPLSLRRQARLAAALLLCTWLMTFILCQPLFRHHPFTVLLLLPGLLAAIHLQRQLLTRVDTNHRPDEEGRLFPTLGAANWITLLRAAAVVGLAGFLPVAILRGPASEPMLIWAPGLIFLALSLADLMDGLLARHQRRETELGRRLDIETDAAGLLVATLLAVSCQRLPMAALLVGLAYYPFVLGIWWRRKKGLPLVTLQPRPYARIIAGVQMGLVAVALLPLLNPVFIFSIAYLVMTVLLAGFIRDWLVVSCRLHADGSQQTLLDRWTERALIRFLPLVLRPLLLVVWAVTLIRGDFPHAPLSWQAALGLCCLLAGLGCLGRSAALLLTLMLSSNLSPFGTAVPGLILFGAAAALMLTGPGPLSLWSPEEGILYRRSREAS